MSLLSVADSYRGKKILLTGSTGFLGKVFLSSLLKQYPDVGQVICLIRAGSHEAARDRFLRDVFSSPAFDPLREERGVETYDYVQQRVTVYRGDLVQELAGLDEETLAAVTTDLDLVIHCAGLVEFVPPLDKALDINVRGTLNCLDLARRAGKGRAGFVHVSTCFVCGSREGQHREALDPQDYPKRAHSGFDGFDAEQEVRIARRLIEEIRRDEKTDPALQADLWEEAGGNKRKVKRLVDIHVRRRMVEVGIERAQRWGWPNTYTYSKALAERLVHAAQDDLGPVTTVRPAVVESAVAYPFPGWNQGINTSAPLVWMTAQGQRYWPSTPDVYLDVIPVDYVAHALVAIGAAVLENQAQGVYQLGTSDKNPFAMRRIVELASLAYRERKSANPMTGFLRRSLDLDSVTVPKAFYERFGLPGQAKLAKRIKTAVDRIPTPEERPRLKRLLDVVRRTTKSVARDLDRGELVLQIYMPFILECPVTFRCDRARRLFASLTPEDQAKIPYRPEELDWRDYWVNIHIPGLERWAFPQLRLQAGGAPTGFEPEFDTLTALFEDRARFGRIVLWRRLNAEGKVASRVTYEEALQRSKATAARLMALGVEPGDRVALLSENSPEWGLGYFATLFAGATVVPLESGIDVEQALSLLEASKSKALLVSRASRETSGEALQKGIEARGLACALKSLEEISVAREKGEALPTIPLESELVPRAPASLIYTSGTTGAPKGVLLGHGAFCKQVRAVATLFNVGSDDRILSVLPLHHCFEFSAGFLLPLYGGATTTYLHETTPEAIRAGLDVVKPTAMIGVPALFEAWHRKVRRKVKLRGGTAERAYEALLAFHRGFRARTKLNVGKRLFPEVHEAFGGSLRFAVSGGAALPLEVALEFEGLGLDIYEGYGLSEAGPVISTNRPGDVAHGSVGKPVPGVEIKVREPDGEGVGEILARTPCVCSGYDNEPELTARILQDGWLHTGDLGRIDAEGYLHVVGRIKDAIVDATGNTVHPDEVEDLYAGCADVSELAVVGISAQGGDHDQVAALVLPRTDVEGGAAEARERIQEFVSQRSEELPYPKRIKSLHFTRLPLPRTQTRKVKRGMVAQMIRDQLAVGEGGARRRGRRSRTGKTLARGGVEVSRIFQDVAGIEATRVVPTADLMQDLGMDSIALAEVALSLAEAYKQPAPRSLTNISTVGDMLDLFTRGGAGDGAAIPITADPRPVILPSTVQRAGSDFLDRLMDVSYGRILQAKVIGSGNIPHHTNAIIVANHCSHLDVGLVKFALAQYGQNLVSAAARDYFFRDTLRASYFDNFTNVVPFDRHESVRQSLERFVGLLRQGKQVLIFPEGTRSVTGRMGAFKPGLGLLVQASRTGVLPVYLHGTHKAMPKGTWLPKVEPLEARIGPFLPGDKLLERTTGMPRRQQADRIVEVVRDALCRLRDGEGFDFDRALPPKAEGEPAAAKKPRRPAEQAP